MTVHHVPLHPPKALLDDDGGRTTPLVALVFAVRTVPTLYDRGSIATQLEAFLGSVATELTLYEYGCLRHLLVVHVL